MKFLKSAPAAILLILSVSAASFGGPKGTTLVAPPWNHCLGLHKVTQFQLNIYSGYSEKFDDPQGLFCTKLSVKDDPESEKDDDELNVFGLNTGRNRLIYNKSLSSIGIVGGPGRGLNQFNSPLSITGDREGNIYVADAGNDRILHLRYFEDGLVAVREIVGEEEDRLAGPAGVSLSGGILYVADTRKDRIVAFGADGSPRSVFKPSLKGASLYRPFGLAVVSSGDEWLHFRDYFIAVTDSMGGRIWKLSTSGEPLAVVRYSSIGGRGSFNHVAIDYYGNIYVTDTINGKIHKFDRNLKYIVAIGDDGTDEGQFDQPRGISIYRRFGQIFISERAGAQYYWIGTDILRLSLHGIYFETESKRCRVDVSFLLTEHSAVTLYLEDESGKNRFTILPEYILPLGPFEQRLTARCDPAESLAKCKLRLVAIAKPTYSSRTYHAVRRESRLVLPTTGSDVTARH